MSITNAASPSPITVVAAAEWLRTLAMLVTERRAMELDTHGAIIGGVACTVVFALMVRPKRGAEALASSQLEPAA